MRVTCSVKDLSGAFALTAIFGLIGALVTAYDKYKCKPCASTLALQRVRSRTTKVTTATKRVEPGVVEAHSSESFDTGLSQAQVESEHRIIARLEAHVDSSLDHVLRYMIALRDAVPSGGVPSRAAATKQDEVHASDAQASEQAHSLSVPPRTPQALELARAKSVPVPSAGPASTLQARLAARNQRELASRLAATTPAARRESAPRAESRPEDQSWV